MKAIQLRPRKNEDFFKELDKDRTESGMRC